MRTRLPHEDADPVARAMKAAAIARLLDIQPESRVLDVGTGSGHIAQWLAENVDGVEVSSIDVVDVRAVSGLYEFLTYDGGTIPFASDSFDIVISNHVVEHVGSESAQNRHLDEIVRVLVPGGVLYLAAPIKYRLVEPHYQLPFLSWLPQPWADWYVRRATSGDRYDVVPPRRLRLLHALRKRGLDVRDRSAEVAADRIARIVPGPLGRFIEPVIRPLTILMPSMVVTATLPTAGGSNG